MKHISIHLPVRLSQPKSLKAGFFALCLTLCTATSLHAASVPATCATIRHGGNGSGSLDNIVVTFPGNAGTLTATHQTVTGGGDSATDLADASSVLLLAALTGHHNAACSKWLEDQGDAAQSQITAGHALGVSWNGVSTRHATTRVSFDSAKLSISKDGANAAASLAFSGVTTSGIEAPSLMPSSAQANFSLPASELANLMAATAGKVASLPAVHVTIRSLTAHRDTVTLSGNGRATLTGEHDSASASGHLEITDISTLIDKARQDSQMKVAAALIMARLVSHKNGNANTWDTTWQGGVLTVNGVPLPLQ